MGLTRDEARRCGLEHLFPGAAAAAGKPSLAAAAEAALEARSRAEAEAAGPGRWEIVAPNWEPAKLNDLTGNPYKAARLKRLDADVVALYASTCRVPDAAGKRRVDLRIARPKGRWPDKDAWWKSTLDALVRARKLVDDGPKWAEMGDVEYERGPLKTVIILTDLWL